MAGSEATLLDSGSSGAWRTSESRALRLLFSITGNHRSHFSWLHSDLPSVGGHTSLYQTAELPVALSDGVRNLVDYITETSAKINEERF